MDMFRGIGSSSKGSGGRGAGPQRRPEGGVRSGGEHDRRRALGQRTESGKSAVAQEAINTTATSERVLY